MRFDVITLFPELFEPFLHSGVTRRAYESGQVDVRLWQLRDFAEDTYKRVDDRPYGGGPGMVMAAEPILRAFAKLKVTPKEKKGKVKVIQLSPSGEMFTNTVAAKFAKQYTDIVFVCGRYEGVDDRVRKILKADEYSIGDFVLTGGELPALVMTDAICRQIPGVLGSSESLEEARTASPRVYTRPDVLLWPQSKKEKAKKYKVPEVLLNGDHKKIEEWRKGEQK